MVLILVRYVLPVAVVLAGIVLFLIDPDVNRFEGSAMLVGAGLSIALFNFLVRAGVDGESERDEERLAREYFDRHGRWPDE